MTFPHMSHPMGKPTICIGENKGADQRHCFRYSDSTIPLLLKSEISSFWLFSVLVQVGLCRICRFSHEAAHISWNASIPHEFVILSVPAMILSVQPLDVVMMSNFLFLVLLSGPLFQCLGQPFCPVKQTSHSRLFFSHTFF